jgi:hypothetical protein
MGWVLLKLLRQLGEWLSKTEVLEKVWSFILREAFNKVARTLLI